MEFGDFRWLLDWLLLMVACTVKDAEKYQGMRREFDSVSRDVPPKIFCAYCLRKKLLKRS